MNFNSSKCSGEERVMGSSSGKIKLTPYSDANYVIEKLLSLGSRYQENLETSMKGSDLFKGSGQFN